MSSVSMSDGPRAWSPRTGRWQTPAGGPLDPAYTAVDSWLVEDGRVRGLERHTERFTRAAVAGGAVGTDDVARFFVAVVAALPRQGRWFPRVELTAGTGELRLRVRPAPLRLDEVVVLSTPFVDRRTAPRTKGPDLDRQLAWRAQADAQEAGEALLAAPDGTITEGVWTTPLWWDGDVLCAVPRGTAARNSVTRALVLALAPAAGVAVGREAPSVDRLRDSETWLLSALHGIRLVTGWLLMPGTTPEPAPCEPGRVETWRARLDALAQPVP
jgi:branched-subunit amino acid aminotransferase/4-amino-4-deoxychorismate lyase